MVGKRLLAKTLLSFDYVKGEDFIYASVLDCVDVRESEEVEIASVQYMGNDRFVMNINMKKIENDFSFETLEEKERIKILKGIIKHELWHIIAGHMFMVNKPIRVNKHRINQSEDVFLKLNSTTWFLYNLATDSIINSNLSEWKEIDAVILVPPEDILEGNLPETEKLMLVGRSQISKKLGISNQLTAEELTAALYVLYKDKLPVQPVFYYLYGDVVPSPESMRERHLLDRITQQIQESIQRRYELDEAFRYNDGLLSRLRGFEKVTSLFQIKAENSNDEDSIDWKKYISDELSKASDLSEGVKTNKHRLSKRYGMAPKLSRRMTPKVTVLIDTSGSISDGLLKRFVNEMEGILRKCNIPLVLYFFSTEAQERQKVDKKGKLLDVKDRGGTNVSAALKQMPREDLEQIDYLIIFTDGFDSFPEAVMKQLDAKKIFIFPKGNYNHNYYKKANEYGKALFID